MLFNSYIFILVFLPLAVIGYFLINKTHKYTLANLYLIGMSLWFYGYYNPSYLPVICVSVVTNYLFSKMMERLEKESLRKWILAVGIIGNAASIFYFKYFDFFIDNMNKAVGTSFELRHIVLPLGISFFTFQQMSYLVDSYRGQTKDYGFVEYALFVVYFPQLIAGPIVLHNETIPQFREEKNRQFSFDNAAKGLFVFSVGLVKKVLVADTFSKAVVWAFGTVDSLTSMDAILLCISYTLQLYFDFSGYCDMAVGIGHMFNIQLPQNFNSPCKATSIVDYWSRWHMSLTRFLRMYVYFPLGGSRKGTVRTYINIMVVFLVSGIWHGANWTFILWGAIHGVLNCLNRMGQKWWDKLHVVWQWFITFELVSWLLILFRSNSVSQAVKIFKKGFTFENMSVTRDFANKFVTQEAVFINKTDVLGRITSGITDFWMWLFIFGSFFIVLNFKNMFEMEFKNSKGQAIMTIVFLVWGIMSLAGVSEFLYFDF